MHLLYRILFYLLLCCIVTDYAYARSFFYAPKWQPYVDVELKASKDRKISRTNLFYPLLQNDHSMLFGDIRVRLDKSKDFEGNIGLGYRRLLSDCDVIVGGYGFFDRRVSTENHYYSQATFGAELLTLSWDLRSNIYLNEHKERPVRDQFTSATLGANNRLLLSQNASTERPLSGFDMEIGRTLPVLDRITLNVGYFHYKKSDFPRIEGMRVRGEWQVNDYLRLLLEGQRDAVRDLEYYVGFGVQYPLGKTSSKMRRLSLIEKRMLTRIYRDVDIVAGGKSRVIENEPATAELAGKRFATIYVINANSTTDLNAFLSAIPEDALVVIQSSGGVIALTDTVTMGAKQTIIGSKPGGFVTINSSLGIPVTLPNSQAKPTITRTAAMIGADKPAIAIPNQADVKLSNLVFKNDNNSNENTISMVRNVGPELVSAVFEGIQSDDQLDIEVSSGQAFTSVTNCNVYGVEIRALSGATINATTNDNTVYRNRFRVTSLGAFNVWGNIFFDTFNGSRINVLSCNNNVTFNDVTKTPATGIGFFSGATSTVRATEILNNTVNDAPGIIGGILLQGHAGGRTVVDKLQGNTVNHFDVSNSDVNIGVPGVSANAAGASAANNNSTFSNFGGVTITNNF